MQKYLQFVFSFVYLTDLFINREEHATTRLHILIAFCTRSQAPLAGRTPSATTTVVTYPVVIQAIYNYIF